MKIQIFHNVKIKSSKKSSKINKNQNLSRYHNSIITNLKFQHKPKYHPQKSSKKKYHPHTIFKNPHIKIDLLLLPRGQNPLSYYTL
jgi:pectate lyase